MLKVGYEIAKLIGKNLGVSAEVVWKIIRNIKTNDMKVLIDAVRKTLRL